MFGEGRRGLSLIEVLVVCAAVALLLGQALPAAHRARGDAQQIECMSKIGQIARAGSVYAAQDPNEAAIPISKGDAVSTQTFVSSYGFGGKSGWTNLHPTAFNLGISLLSGRYFMDAANRPLNTVLYKRIPKTELAVPFQATDWTRDARLDLDVYSCPADSGFPGMHHNGWKVTDYTSYNYYGTSYAANVLFVNFSGTATLSSISPYGHSLSSIPNPQKTVTYLENAGRFALYAPNTDDYDQTGCYWNSSSLYVAARTQGMVARGHHGDDWHFNVAAADGHAMYAYMKGHGRMLPPPGLPPVCLPESGGAGCACIYVRGLEWQRDALPAAPVVTPKLAFTSGGGILPDDGGTYSLVK